jgi:type II secretory pathway pseudopilin PulG
MSFKVGGMTSHASSVLRENLRNDQRRRMRASRTALRVPKRNERGETLLEVVIALVVIGLVIGAFFATFSTASASSTTQQNSARSDEILRNVAEATKNAVRDQCADATASKPGVTYVTTTTSLPPGFSLTATSTPSGQACPAVTSLQKVTFSLTAPNAAARSLTIQLRTP